MSRAPSEKTSVAPADAARVGGRSARVCATAVMPEPATRKSLTNRATFHPFVVASKSTSAVLQSPVTTARAKNGHATRLNRRAAVTGASSPRRRTTGMSAPRLAILGHALTLDSGETLIYSDPDHWFNVGLEGVGTMHVNAGGRLDVGVLNVGMRGQGYGELYVSGPGARVDVQTITRIGGFSGKAMSEVTQGIRSTCPGWIVSLVSPFALLIAATDVPCFRLIR